MTLFDWLMTWEKIDLAKALAQHAKEKAHLLDEVDRLEHEVFWMKVADRNQGEQSEVHTRSND
jgi:hypothetical protein